MKRCLILVPFCIGLLAGCGGEKLADNVNADDAGQALRTAMDAWKAGKTRDELKSGSPSIIMNELAWKPETQLVDYQMADAGELNGRQMRWVVQLKLKDKSGKTTDKKATYIIDTIPQIVIVRDDFAS